MVSLEKWMILTPLQKLTKNGEDWGKLIVAKGFKKLHKFQNITKSGPTANIQKYPRLICIKKVWIFTIKAVKFTVVLKIVVNTPNFEAKICH